MDDRRRRSNRGKSKVVRFLVSAEEGTRKRIVSQYFYLLPFFPSVMSFNASSASSSSIFHKYSAQELYAGTDFSTLNWVERQWMSWYLLIGDPVIATGLASFLLHEVGSHLMFVTIPSLITQTPSLSTSDVVSLGS
jgi:hypothetical protein